MREDGLRLVRFRQNEYEHMHNIIRSLEMIEALSFYVDNPDLYESGRRSIIMSGSSRRISGRYCGKKEGRRTGCLPSKTANRRWPTIA